jgi:hypothetical protein
MKLDIPPMLTGMRVPEPSRLYLQEGSHAAAAAAADDDSDA